jgi:hypothetical protein
MPSSDSTQVRWGGSIRPIRIQRAQSQSVPAAGIGIRTSEEIRSGGLIATGATRSAIRTTILTAVKTTVVAAILVTLA